jgi:hypothetical protein
LPLGLHPSRSVDAGNFIAGLLPGARLAYPDNGIHRVVCGRCGLLPTSAATTAAAARPLTSEVSAAVDLDRLVLLRLLGFVGCGLIGCGASTPAASPAAAPTATLANLALGSCVLRWFGLAFLRRVLLGRRSFLEHRFLGSAFLKRGFLGRRHVRCKFGLRLESGIAYLIRLRCQRLRSHHIIK